MIILIVLTDKIENTPEQIHNNKKRGQQNKTLEYTNLLQFGRVFTTFVRQEIKASWSIRHLFSCVTKPTQLMQTQHDLRVGIDVVRVLRVGLRWRPRRSRSVVTRLDLRVNDLASSVAFVVVVGGRLLNVGVCARRLILHLPPWRRRRLHLLLFVFRRRLFTLFFPALQTSSSLLDLSEFLVWNLRLDSCDHDGGHLSDDLTDSSIV